MNAVVLLSGGIDSTTTLAIALNQGYSCFVLSFDYGQRHKKELKSAKKIVDFYKKFKIKGKIKEHKVIKIDLSQIGGSALTDKNINIPERSLNEIFGNIPITYVPSRNIIFLSLALSYSETINAEKIFIGANVIDYSGYPDCRPEFIKSFEKTANLGTKIGLEKGIKILTPLINLTKAEIIKKGKELGVPFHLTWSCYKGGRRGCGKCDSCLLRLKGFRDVGFEDEIEYEVIN